MVKINEVALRDGNQSLIATRMTTEEVLGVVETLDNVGFHALEVWGGATFDSCIRFLSEDPWHRLREIRKHAKNTKLSMLLRGQNLLGYKHYADDVVDKFIEKSIKNGIDIIRCFDALNDLRNLDQAAKSIKKHGGHLQLAISYTTSDVHTIEYFVNLAKDMEKMGADSICIKDMSGILLPDQAFDLVTKLKSAVKVPLNLHCHATAGISEMTLKAAIDAGIDIIDTAMSPFSGGTSHPPTESMVRSLEGTKHDPKLNIEAMNSACEYLTTVRDKYLANGILNPKALLTNPFILEYQVPGGMLSNLMSQLEGQGKLDKYDEVLKEVPKVRKDLGYPPLVTPLSQMVGTQAVMNVITGQRYKMIPTEIKEYVRGNYGKSPVEISDDIVKTIIGDETRITHRPADTIEPQFDNAKKEFKKICKTDEEVLACIVFPQTAIPFYEEKNSGKKKKIINLNLNV